MSDLEFRRRVMMQWGISGDKWDEFLLGQICGADLSDMNYSKVAMTPLIPLTPGHSVIFVPGIVGTQSVSSLVQIIYFSDTLGTQRVARRTISNSRTIQIESDWKSCRMPFNFDNIADAYIKDNTTGEYLWRGSDYVD